MTKIQKEYKAGFASGYVHDDCDILCAANRRKMSIGLEAKEPMVRAYWQGYHYGLNESTKYQGLYFNDKT